MENEKVRLIRESVKRLLQEGSRYLYIVDNFYNRARSNYSEFQRMLHIMDNYSRHKAGLQQDMELLIECTEIFGSEDNYHNNYDDYDDDDDDDYDDDYYEDYDEDTETEEDEETVSDGGYDMCDDCVNRLMSAITEKKNALTRLELLLLQKVESYNSLLKLQFQLQRTLQNYCGRVITVLRQITGVEKRLNNARLADRFIEKRMKLAKILAHITEKQKFFCENHTSAMETA